MQTPLVTALVLVATLVLTACESEPQDKMDAAKESLSDAASSVQDAAQQTKEAIEQKSEQLIEE